VTTALSTAISHLPHSSDIYLIKTGHASPAVVAEREGAFPRECPSPSKCGLTCQSAPEASTTLELAEDAHVADTSNYVEIAFGPGSPVGMRHASTSEREAWASWCL
jgi:hypothetical protein